MKKYFKQLKANKKGFTLIEMIVVIAIIGILAAILVPSMAGYLETARDSRKEANAKTVYTAAQAAVTSLENSKTPVTTNTYTYKKGEEIPHVNLFNKISGLIGTSNYEKFNSIIVDVKDGAVISVIVEDASGVATYPQPQDNKNQEGNENQDSEGGEQED